MSEPTVLIVGRRRGRPRLDPDQSSIRVCLAIPEDQYDLAYQRAGRDRQKVPDVIRTALHRWLSEDHR